MLCFLSNYVLKAFMPGRYLYEAFFQYKSPIMTPEKTMAMSTAAMMVLSWYQRWVGCRRGNSSFPKKCIGMTALGSARSRTVGAGQVQKYFQFNSRRRRLCQQDCFCLPVKILLALSCLGSVSCWPTQ